MANAFDIKQATSIVQVYDGSPEHLDAFVDSATLLAELTNAAHLATAVKFLRTRLAGKAKIGIANNFPTIDAIVADVKARCEAKTSPEEITAKMNSLKEKDQDKLCDQIKDLTAKLSALYMADNVPPEVAQKMATKTGIDTLKKKVSSPDTKLDRLIRFTKPFRKYANTTSPRNRVELRDK